MQARFGILMLLIILFLSNCRYYGSTHVNYIYSIDRDSCFYQERIIGVNSATYDTLCTLTLRLKDWRNTFFLDENLKMGIEVKKIIQGNSFTVNIIYHTPSENLKIGEFYNTSHNGESIARNFDDDKSITMKINRAFQVLQNGSSINIHKLNFFNEDDIRRLLRELKTIVKYQKIFFTATMSDDRETLIAHID